MAEIIQCPLSPSNLCRLLVGKSWRNEKTAKTCFADIILHRKEKEQALI